MAIINVTVTPKQGPNGKSMVFDTDGGLKYTVCKLTIPSGQTYSQVNRIALVHDAGSDFRSHYGARIIKAVLCEAFACNNVSFGALQLGFLPATQVAGLLVQGNGGGVSPTGPQDGAELANATALGTGTMTATAEIYW